MTTSTATLVHTSSRKADNALRVARVAAAGRVAVERQAAEARAAAGIAHNRAMAQAWVDQTVADGATMIGMKVCFHDGGKFRTRFEPEYAAQYIAVKVADGDSIEAWGLADNDVYVGEVLSVW